MKGLFKIVILVIGMLCFTYNSVLAQKYSPTEEVGEIIEAMGELEESYEDNQWEEALESTEKIDKEVKGIIAQIKTDDLNLQGALDNLKKSVAGHNSEDTELAYIIFQRRVFSLLNDFEYDVHPVLTILEQYIIEEAGEAAEKNDFEEVLSEMRESGNLFKYAKPLLSEKGVSQQALSEFNAKIIALIRAGNHNDNKKVAELLKEIQAQYKIFLSHTK
jgi:hypothetical protein